MAEILIMNGHNTPYRDPYQYSIRQLVKKFEILCKNNDKSRAIDAQVNLTTNIASNGMGGKEAMKSFKQLIKELNG